MKKIIFTILTLTVALLPTFVMAENNLPEIPLEIIKEMPSTALTGIGEVQKTIIPNIINYVGNAGVALSVAVLVYAGILYLTAEGSEDKIKKAHKAVEMGIIALVVIIMAWTVVNIVIGVFMEPPAETQTDDSDLLNDLPMPDTDYGSGGELPGNFGSGS